MSETSKNFDEEVAVRDTACREEIQKEIGEDEKDESSECKQLQKDEILQLEPTNNEVDAEKNELESKDLCEVVTESDNAILDAVEAAEKSLDAHGTLSQKNPVETGNVAEVKATNDEITIVGDNATLSDDGQDGENDDCQLSENKKVCDVPKEDATEIKVVDSDKLPAVADNEEGSTVDSKEETIADKPAAAEVLNDGKDQTTSKIEEDANKKDVSKTTEGSLNSEDAIEMNKLQKEIELSEVNVNKDITEGAKVVEESVSIEKQTDSTVTESTVGNASQTKLTENSTERSEESEVLTKPCVESASLPEPVEKKSTTDLEQIEKESVSLEDGSSVISADNVDKIIDKISAAEEMAEIVGESKKGVAEVIEIDDDEEEVATKKASLPALKEDAPKEVTTEDVSSTEDQKEESTEALKTNDNSEANIGASARMHTMPIIFYNKECINFECPKNDKEFHRAPQFAMNYFKVVKKKVKVQYICGECYDTALNFYEDLCGMLNSKQPILLRDITSKKQEFVEILDSSDEEDNSTNDNDGKEKDNTSLSKTDLSLIETELENSIRSIFNRVEIQNQLTWSKTIFTERVQKLQDELEYIDAELSEQQKLADKMYNNLYESGKYRINILKPVDLDNETADQVPPFGEIERPPIKIGELYYAAKHKAIASWLPCRAVEQLESTHVGMQKNVPHFRVKFVSSQYQTFKNLSAKLIAYYDPPNVRLSVGQRVIAYFDGSTLSSRDKDKNVVQSAFYPGIIAEEMKTANFFRYLIFYDDGYTQYVSHKDVRLVCHVARNVWEDVDQSSREFIQKYVMEYRVNRPMVQTHKGQKMATESNGRWVPARVIDIDCSLVRMQFEGPTKNHKEWIYRGSLRLNPVYMEYQKSKNSQANQMPISRLPRRTEPFIRYTEDEENIRGSLGAQQRNVNRPDTATTASQAPKVRHLNANTIYLEDENKPKGKVIYYTAKRQLPTKTYRSHKCSPDCLIVVPHNLNGYSPLAKPLLSGWERVFLRQKAKKRVFYRAPCGKSFRDMKELHKYLRLTKNTLNVDSFDFYPETSCLAEFEAENINLRKRDISNGQEKMPLPLVNYYDETLPECTYSAKVIPTEGVNINTNPDFLICCDCEDDCVDKEKCACWQLTIEGVKSINPDAQIEDIGYQYKRLYDHLPTGIYECNSRCKCKSHCINRVVQHSLEMKLQVFKTSNRGWGLRCLNDIPRGSFVCIYAGNLLTESKANEGGLDAGDEYFAELDYIETVEQLKEGYESDVEMQEDDEEEDPYIPDDDVDFQPGKSFLSRSKRSQRQLSAEGERQAINFNPNVTIEDDTKKKRPSVRQFFGKDEAVYVMDAKVTGNLGRYFNHSCSPNLFVQNVFVDTHDVRFPWVAFFSLTHIRAGSELTWNYNYEVGVVPGKVLYCQCGAPNCRQRLL